MTRLTLGSTTILISPIGILEGMTRRQCERATVASMLHEYYGRQVDVQHDAEGAPHLPMCNISISHSRRLAVVALDACESIGVDAEEWRDALYRVKDRFLSEIEIDTFAAPTQLLAAWTIKEAVYKVVGAQATEFAAAIAIDGDMAQAECLGRRFTVWTTDMEDTHISLVREMK